MEHSAKLIIRLAQEADDYSNSWLFSASLGWSLSISTSRITDWGRAIPWTHSMWRGCWIGAEDKAAEEFLRISEPPAHDKWESTDELASVYVPGGVKSIREFKELVRREFARLLLDPRPRRRKARTASNVSSRSELLPPPRTSARPPAG